MADDFKIALVSDTHLGSTYSQVTSLREFYKQAELAGCESVLHCGDLVDGVKINNSHLRLFGSPEALLGYTSSNYPDNLPTYWITGNHEERITDEFEIDIGKEISYDRRDMRCLGHNEGKVTMHGKTFYLYHGNGTRNPEEQMLTGYNHSTGYVDAVFCGHLHSYHTSRLNSVPVMVVPSFQATPPYMKCRSVIAGVILTLGEDRTTSISILPYSERQNDY
jgi:predicted phosphodiesterase